MKKIKIAAALVVLFWISRCSNGFEATYHGTLDGMQIECQIQQDGDALTGTFNDHTDAIYQLEGNFQDNQSQGTMSNGTYMMQYTATFSENTCMFHITQPSGRKIQVALQNNSASTGNERNSASSGSEHDPAVVGRWEMGSSSGSTGSATYASLVGVTYFEFFADGTYSMKSGGSAIMTGNGYYSSSEGGAGSSGNWHTQDGYIIMDGPYAGKEKYTMHGDKLVFGSAPNAQFLYPN